MMIFRGMELKSISAQDAPIRCLPLEVSSNTKGTSGEYYIISDLLRQGVECYSPVSDEVNTDLVVYHRGAFRRIQIKTIGVYRSHTQTSIEVRMRENKQNNHIDYVAIYLWMDGLVAYYPYDGKEKVITLALRTAKNHQTTNRKWFYEYQELT